MEGYHTVALAIVLGQPETNNVRDWREVEEKEEGERKEKRWGETLVRFGSGTIPLSY